MKSIFTIFLIFLCGFVALASTANHGLELKSKIESNDQVKVSEISNLLDNGIVIAPLFFKDEQITNTQVARLYKFKNARIKKALTFKTIRNNAKTA